jgi:hypothetical protein
MSWWVGLLIWNGIVFLTGSVVLVTRAGWKLWGFVIVTATLVLTLAFVSNNRYEKSCEQKGGHTGPKSLCLTPDGRVIE